jgi:hypothetical protein
VEILIFAGSALACLSAGVHARNVHESSGTRYFSRGSKTKAVDGPNAIL